MNQFALLYIDILIEIVDFGIIREHDKNTKYFSFLQPFNTVNLENWCLYELSKNFEKVRTHKDYAKISEENRSVLEARGSGLGNKDRGLLSDDHPTYRKSCIIL